MLEQRGGIVTQRFRQRYELDHIDAALSSFDQRYERLISADPHRELGLGEVGSFSSFRKHLDKALVIAPENGLGHVVSADSLARVELV